MNSQFSILVFAALLLVPLAALQAAETPKAAPQRGEFGYRPDGMNMWDPWFVEHQGEVHLFHLQRLRGGSGRTAAEADHIGHAVSPDLIHWTERPLMVGPGRAYRLRVHVRANRYELFVDDELVLQGAFPPTFRRTEPSVGLFVDRGEAVVRRVAVYRQEPNPARATEGMGLKRLTHKNVGR